MSSSNAVPKLARAQVGVDLRSSPLLPATTGWIKEGTGREGLGYKSESESDIRHRNLQFHRSDLIRSAIAVLDLQSMASTPSASELIAGNEITTFRSAWRNKNDVVAAVAVWDN